MMENDAKEAIKLDYTEDGLKIAHQLTLLVLFHVCVCEREECVSSPLPGSAVKASVQNWQARPQLPIKATTYWNFPSDRNHPISHHTYI